VSEKHDRSELHLVPFQSPSASSRSKLQIIQAIKEECGTKFNDFPVFWDTSLKHIDTNDKAIQQIESFEAHLAARGCLPKGITSFLQVHLRGEGGKLNARVRTAILDIQVIVLDAFWQSWRDHSKAFYQHYSQ
jgi:hypothetical protein